MIGREDFCGAYARRGRNRDVGAISATSAIPEGARMSDKASRIEAAGESASATGIVHGERARRRRQVREEKGPDHGSGTT
jgi:hypothetical protein